MRTEKLKLAAAGAAAAFGLGLIASGCAPAGSGPVARPAVDNGRPGVVAGRAPSLGPARVTATPTSTPTSTSTPTPTFAPAAAVPSRPAHIVIVMDENHSKLGAAAPYIASLRQGGASFPNAYAVTHPSQPNYLALFSGTTHGVTNDDCPQSIRARNLASQLAAHGRAFVGYSESMPSDGYTGCAAGDYARKHNPWVDFANVKASANLRFSRFPSDFDKLPTVSWVVPDLCSDMHDCSVATGDKWLKRNLGAYAKWAKTHHSLLIVTFDEAERGVANKVPLIIYGDGVKPGTHAVRVDHYSVLRLIQTLYGLPCLAKSCGAKPITGIWG